MLLLRDSLQGVIKRLTNLHYKILSTLPSLQRWESQSSFATHYGFPLLIKKVLSLRIRKENERTTLSVRPTPYGDRGRIPCMSFFMIRLRTTETLVRFPRTSPTQSFPLSSLYPCFPRPSTESVYTPVKDLYSHLQNRRTSDEGRYDGRDVDPGK